MPILIKDFTWRQTDECIIVKIPLRGPAPTNVDLFTCDNFIKLHFPPFLFEICLRDLIDDDKSVCRLLKDEIELELVKSSRGQWDELEAVLTKAEKLEVKKRAVDIAHQRIQQQIKKKEEKRSEQQRAAVRSQIALDTTENEVIEHIKKAEIAQAMCSLEDWRSESQRELLLALEEKAQVQETSPPSNIIETKMKGEEKLTQTKKLVKTKESKPKKPEPVTLPPRSSGTIKVSFTPRVFPTPLRESKQDEENEWLRKQAEARRKTGFVIEDLRPEEHDPQWLKDKGDSFYNVENYLGAISAYSHAIKLNPKIPALYSNRAACHLALGNYRRVIQDTTMCLELLTPRVEMNAKSRSICHTRRASALCALQMYEAGIADFQEALKLCPDNIQLKQDIDLARHRMENSKDDSQNDSDDDTIL